MSGNAPSSAIAATVTAWNAGARTVRDLAARQGIGESAAANRLQVARAQGRLPYPPSVSARLRRRLEELGPDAPELRVRSLAALTRGAWRDAGREPILVTQGGVVIGEWIPAAGPSLSRETAAATPYEPDPEPTVELAKLALEVAEALAETEELRDLIAPRARIRSSRRQAEAVRRRRHWIELKAAANGDQEAPARQQRI